jgi:hypothetical protein
MAEPRRDSVLDSLRNLEFTPGLECSVLHGHDAEARPLAQRLSRLVQDLRTKGRHRRVDPAVESVGVNDLPHFASILRGIKMLAQDRDPEVRRFGGQERQGPEERLLCLGEFSTLGSRNPSGEGVGQSLTKSRFVSRDRSSVALMLIG